jgi:hypothetical protein
MSYGSVMVGVGVLVFVGVVVVVGVGVGVGNELEHVRQSGYVVLVSTLSIGPLTNELVIV